MASLLNEAIAMAAGAAKAEHANELMIKNINEAIAQGVLKGYFPVDDKLYAGVGSHCFRIEFIHTGGSSRPLAKGVSVSFYRLACGSPITGIETALYGSNSKLVYLEEFGYGDVVVHEEMDTDHLIKHLNRLCYGFDIDAQTEVAEDAINRSMALDYRFTCKSHSNQLFEGIKYNVTVRGVSSFDTLRRELARVLRLSLPLKIDILDMEGEGDPRWIELFELPAECEAVLRIAATTTTTAAPWLESVHEGYGRFASAFDEYGVESEGDLRTLDADDKATIFESLTTLGVKPLNLKKIRQALESLSAADVPQASAASSASSASSASPTMPLSPLDPAPLSSSSFASPPAPALAAPDSVPDECADGGSDSEPD